MLTNSPLGTNVPLYNPADRSIPDNTQAGALVSQLAGRTFFRPDVVGQYTVLATITTTGVNNGTNIAPATTNIAITITAATYYGLQTCEACHSGGVLNAPSIYPTYTNTPHASFFTRAIDGLVSSYYNQSCIQCHVLGYDTNSFAVNGGFDDIAKVYGWTFPSRVDQRQLGRHAGGIAEPGQHPMRKLSRSRHSASGSEWHSGKYQFHRRQLRRGRLRAMP